MKLPTPPNNYQPSAESTRNRVIEQADTENFKRGRDLEVGSAAHIILTAPNGTRWKVTVSNAGALSTVAA